MTHPILSIELTPVEIIQIRDGVYLTISESWVPPHECCEHLQHKEAHSVAPHGEHFDDDFYRCGVCDREFTQDEAEQLFEEQEQQ